MKKYNLIGDIHGNLVPVEDAVKRDLPCIQVGDFGFSKEWNKASQRYTKNQLRIIPGNHDDYNVCLTNKLCLGNYGLVEGLESTFFVRGAFSIDRFMGPPSSWRVEGIDWWPDEELTIEQAYKALELYETVKPSIVLSHDGPLSILNTILPYTILPSLTSSLLDEMLKIHQPEKWFFGHHHHSVGHYLNNSYYRCLGINEILEVELV